MESLTLILLLCISVPLAVLSFFLDKKGRMLCYALITGMLVAIVASFLDSWALREIPKSPFFITTNLTPLIEELLKALPLICLAFAVKLDRPTTLSYAMALGIGFSLIENCYILINSLANVSFFWVVCRVFGANLMHGFCTAIVGIGVSYVRTRRKLFLTGTFALFLTATIFHSIFNSLIQSNLYLVAMFGATAAVSLFYFFFNNNDRPRSAGSVR